jgi:hypothetical protein
MTIPSISDISSTINKGVATVTTGLSAIKATDNLLNGASTTKTDPTKQSNTGDLPSIILNPLENFASYTPVWTLACLEPKQFNNPSEYRNSASQLKHIVLSSGGRFDKDRAPTAYGIPEYYINNFVMKAIVGGNKKTGNSNAFKFEWDIYEPYSMGLLLQSLQVAAQNAGYLNYLNNAPYVLRLDFMGYDELGKPYTSIKPKFFVLGLTGVKFTVNEGGSTYKMEAIPFNHKGFSDTVNIAYNDMKIAAGEKGTVDEVLNGNNPESLTSVLNAIEQRLVDDKQIKYPDVYDIQFPKTSDDFTPNSQIKGVSSATVTPGEKTATVITGTTAQAKTTFSENEIGGASLGFDQSRGGNYVMKKNDKRDEKTGLINRDKMTIDPKKRVFQFAQGQTLTAIINQIILSSDYAKKAIDPKNVVDGGFIKWFRIDIQIELLEYDDWVGDYAKKFTFRVVPFYVHQSIFTNPNSTLPYAQIQKQICKGYNYIYTGKNVDVLKFDININNLFFTGITPSKPSDAGQASDPNTSGGPAPQQNSQTRTETGANPVAQAATTGRPRMKRDPGQLSGKIKGGSGSKNSEQMVAESFHKAFTGSNTEMVTVNLEILGDPYWMVDSGMGNYFAKPIAETGQLTEDGTMNYESGDVYIYITFKTPVDVNETTGTMDFPLGGKESPFSGIYRVNSCESKFSEGTFKQTLGCIRLAGQAQDYKDVPQEFASTFKVDKASSGTTTFGPPEPLRNSLQDDVIPDKDGDGWFDTLFADVFGNGNGNRNTPGGNNG